MGVNAKGVLSLAAGVGIVAGLARCTTSDATAPREALSSERASRVVARSLLPSAGEEVQWTAEVHTAAMQDVMQQQATLRKLVAPQRCARIAEIARSHFPSVAAATGNSDPTDYETGITQALEAINCSTDLESTDGGPVPEDIGLNIDGPLAPYGQAMHDVLMNATTPDAVAAGLDSIVASAGALSLDDHEVLAGLASLGASSVYYWSASNARHEVGSSDVETFSETCGKACKLGWADLGGGLLGAYGGGLPGSVAGAIVGSAVAAITM